MAFVKQSTSRSVITRRALLASAVAAGCSLGLPAFLRWRGFLPLANGRLSRSLLFHTSLLRRLVVKEPEGVRSGWAKCGRNPVLGGELGTCFDACVLREEGGYRMWFSWRTQRSIGVTESPDGIAWAKPKIAVRPELAWELLVNRPTVVQMAKGYEMWYTGQDESHSWIGHAISSDGMLWQRTSASPVFSPEKPWEEKSVMAPHVLYNRETEQYRMWYSGGEQYEPNAIGYAVSTDGRRWTRLPQPVFIPGSRGSFDQDRVAGACVVVMDDWHIMFYIGFRDVSDAAIGIARSKDGITGWQRHPANPVIAPGEHFADWDFESVYKPSAVAEQNRWMLWYNGRRETVEQIGLAQHTGIDLGF